MFVRKRQNLMERLKMRRFRHESTNIAFVCLKPVDGFEVDTVYKPFAYSVGAYDYSDFAIFDKHGKVFYMTNKYIKRGYFTVVPYANLFVNAYVQEEKDAIRLIEYENKFWRKVIS